MNNTELENFSEQEQQILKYLEEETEKNNLKKNQQESNSKLDKSEKEKKATADSKIETPDKSENRYITNTFVSPHYKSISSCYENQIEISLVNSEAEPFVFQSGAVHVTLHFRKKQQ